MSLDDWGIDEDAVEHTLTSIRECFVYRLPPRPVTGYKAADWDVKNYIWTGRLSVKSKGNDCNIILEDHDPAKGTFAVCPYREGSVESVTDSSRYFILRIENQGRHAFIGVGFAERNEAFDFNSALQDHQRYVKQRQEEKEAVKRLETAPKKDYSLKEGEKITVDVKISKPERTGQSVSERFGNFDTGGNDIFLPPPPTSGQRGHRAPARPQQSPSQPQQSQPSFGASDPFSDFGSGSNNFSSAPSSSDPWGSSSSSTNNQQKKNDPWGDFNF